MDRAVPSIPRAPTFLNRVNQCDLKVIVDIAEDEFVEEVELVVGQLDSGSQQRVNSIAVLTGPHVEIYSCIVSSLSLLLTLTSAASRIPCRVGLQRPILAAIADTDLACRRLSGKAC